MAAATRGMDSDSMSMLQRMQQRVLSWDYFTLGSDEEASHAAQLRQLPTTFANFQEYVEAFEPLILEECTAQILRGEEDSVCEPHISISTSCERVGPFHVVRFGLESGKARLYKDNDLVLVSKLPPKDDVDEGAHHAHTHAMGVVETHEGAVSLRLRLYLPETATHGGPRRAANEARFRSMRSEVAVMNSPWWLLRLCNLSTIQREWLALHQAGNLPFRDVILAAADRASRLRTTWRIPGPLAASLKGAYNASQVEAIQAGLDTQPIVLIQGPPGTGKTATLLALLSVIMHAVRVPTTFSHGRSLQDANAAAAAQRAPRPGEGERVELWRKASPWLHPGGNPRDALPEDPDSLGALGPRPSKPEVLGQAVQRSAHVLVCAPSNSALDEIVLRLMNTGLRDASGAPYKPSVVRVGLNPHRSVEGVFLDRLVEQRLASAAQAGGAGKRGGGGGGGGGREGGRSRGEPTALERDRARLAILDDASIVACTLSFSGSGLLSRTSRQFDVVVIDEAAQAVEPSTLVPLAYGCKQMFLVGDPVQLPATVLSETARALGYETSMFKRFQSAGYPVHMLRTQYRMHPHIREFPSREFYAEALQDGEEMAEKTSRPWHAHPALGPLTFVNVEGEQYHPEGTNSWANDDEAAVILLLVKQFLRYGEAVLQEGGGLAVVSPYKAQVANVKQKLLAEFGERTAELIDVNTIDGFQGREKDVVIFSVVRAPQGAGRSIGFVADERRVNVGLTRARASLIVVGSARALRIDEHWSNLVTHAKDQGRFVTAFKPYNSFIDGLEKADPTMLHLSGGPEPEDYEEIAGEGAEEAGEGEDWEGDGGGGAGDGAEGAGEEEQPQAKGNHRNARKRKAGGAAAGGEAPGAAAGGGKKAKK